MKSPCETCRDELALRFPGRSIAVTENARQHCSGGAVAGHPLLTEFAIAILPGFNFEACQRFTGTDLAECMAKVNRLTPAAAH